MMVNILKKMKREMGERILPEDNAGSFSSSFELIDWWIFCV